MSYNFSNNGGTARTSKRCLYDSNKGYQADFSVNGDVSGWDFYNGIYTYGCWNNFIFGTLYGDYGLIGRYDSFLPFSAVDFYKVNIVMKLYLVDRALGQEIPSTGRIAWRTIQSPDWSDDKECSFDLIYNGEWNSYTINLSELYYWVGDVFDLRIWPIYSSGKDGDEFFISKIEVTSDNTYRCLNSDCSFYNNYEHNCPGKGSAGYCKSNFFQFNPNISDIHSSRFDIVEENNDYLYININGYGYESIKIKEVNNLTGRELANEVRNGLSKIAIGGYSGCEVVYGDDGEFTIYSGTYTDDSFVTIGYSLLAEQMGFFNGTTLVSSDSNGDTPASGYKPLSSFRISNTQLNRLFDFSDDTEFYFNPFLYNVEVGRRDFIDAGLGSVDVNRGSSEFDPGDTFGRDYEKISNVNKTIIDFSHPANASGRIKKIYAALTLDTLDSTLPSSRGAYDSNRIDSQLYGAKVMFFRPMNDGTLRVLDYEIDIKDRDHDSGNLYSATQEYIELDCDLFINKGDLIGVYNANVYIGKSFTGNEVDASYYQLDGKANGTVDVGPLLGDGSSGLLVYGRSDQIQNKLIVDIDLNDRVNIDSVSFYGSTDSEELGYNVMRCLDVDWSIDLFNEDHTTGYVYQFRPLVKHYYNHRNVYYGKSCLTDGIKIVSDGLASDSFSVDLDHYSTAYDYVVGTKSGGDGVIPYNPTYFSVNGDCEWLGVYMYPNRQRVFHCDDFQFDPISFTVIFPHNKEKRIYKSNIYFKDAFNFRSFEVSTYMGEHYDRGDADDPKFELIKNRDDYETPWTKIILDWVEYTPENTDHWKSIDLYLAKNPTIGHPIYESTGVFDYSFNESMSYYDSMGGLNLYAEYVITNNEQFKQATNLDWTVLSHEWEPFYSKGFRFYCVNHKSTKITEFELYCYMENVKSSIGGSVFTNYSFYGSEYLSAQAVSDYEKSVFYLGDTPRYLELEFSPITEIRYSNVLLDVSYEDVYVGEKGCEYDFLPIETKINSVNEAQLVEFKNVYGKTYDLHVNISRENDEDKGLLFYTKLNNASSVTNPDVGPDSFYRKEDDYPLVNYQSNVAINCPVYSLDNLVDGAVGWYSNDGGDNWFYYGTLSGSASIDFSNMSNAGKMVIELPSLVRSKWWKFSFLDSRLSMGIKEILLYYNDEKIENVNFFHNKNQDIISDANTDLAVHLNNDIVDGSYYVLEDQCYIGFELPDTQVFNKIILYCHSLDEYEHSHDKAGIDKATQLCIHGDGINFQKDSIVDYSYYERETQIVGNNIYCDTSDYHVNYSFTEDFTGDFGSDIHTFASGISPDPKYWDNVVNATIVDEELHITNSGTIGEVTFKDLHYNDFSTTVDVDIDGAYDSLGWGSYLEVFDLLGNYIRVGRKYRYVGVDGGAQIYSSEEFGSTGLQTIITKETSENENLKFSISRNDNVVNCSVYDSEGYWKQMGSSTLLSTNPVKFRLVTDLSALADDITTTKFDNFNIDRSDYDWNTNTSYSSTFTAISGVCDPGVCASGIDDSYSVYYFDMGVDDSSNASGYKRPLIYDSNDRPLDQNFSFTFDFTFKIDSIKNPEGTSSNNAAVSVGLLDIHRYGGDYFVGAQVSIKRDDVGIAVVSPYHEREDTYTNLDTTTNMHFCRFTGDGQGNYSCYVWADDWDGYNLVATLNLTSYLTWNAFRVGVGSGYTRWNYTYRAKGWVSSFDFSCSKISKSYRLEPSSSIRFNGVDREFLKISNNSNPNCNIISDGFNFGSRSAVIDFFIKFNSIPEEQTGGIVSLLKYWDDSQSFEGDVSNCSWALNLENENNGYYIRFYISKSGQAIRYMSKYFKPDLQRWYHFYIYKNIDGSNYHAILLDGHTLYKEYKWQSSSSDGVDYSNNFLKIGCNFDGWLEEIRVSSKYGDCRSTGTIYNEPYSYNLSKPVPTTQYERYYTFSLYNSVDNTIYGKSFDVDAVFNNSYSYYFSGSYWHKPYYSYFAIDLGQRHDIGIIRSFPRNVAYDFDKENNVVFSNKDVSNPHHAFRLTDGEENLNKTFNQKDLSFPDGWSKFDTDETESFVYDNTFYQHCFPSSSVKKYCLAKPDYYFKGDFDFYIDYILNFGYSKNNSWFARLQIDDLNDSDNSVIFERCFYEGYNQFIFWIKNGSGWQKKYFNYRNDRTASIRLRRYGDIFSIYVKDIDQELSDFLLMDYHEMANDFGNEVQFSLYLISDSTSFPNISVYWDNFIVNQGTPIYSSYNDARWLNIRLFSGDSTERIIKRVGVYPDISSCYNAVGQYNTKWTYIGSSITSFTNEINLALTSTVDCSSSLFDSPVDNINNGVVSNGDFTKCWCSDGGGNPWVTFEFNTVESIYKFEIYHGYYDNDYANETSDKISNIIVNYKIQVSEDGTTFTTVFSVTGNEELIRVHELSTPVSAKVVRFYVEAYRSEERLVVYDNVGSFKIRESAVLREVKIFRYPGFTILNSEETPIIAIDLKNQYFIKGHTLIGVDEEDTSRDWSNSDSNFAWAGSRLSEPHKVNFSKFGEVPDYDRWVVIKRNTATAYPTIPTSTYPNTDTPDYLKYALIRGVENEFGQKPNPINYPWMWGSSVSSLESDYSVIAEDGYISRSLKVNYPATSTTDHLYFIEGDYFWVDEFASWRDGFGFYFYIEDLNKLDLNYGYFYLGGFDYTESGNPITYKWNMTTISGILEDGWNYLNLMFILADSVEYTETDGFDPRRLDTINFGKMGMIYRGKGESFSFNLDGCYIKRNHFEYGCAFNENGLYLTDNDYLKANVGSIDFKSFTIEFFLRADWKWDGRDAFGDYEFRSLFHFSNTDNDIVGAYVSERGLEVYYGNLIDDCNVFIIIDSELGISPLDNLIHLGFVFSNDGSSIGSDSSTIRVYINNTLVGKTTNTWYVSDYKHFNFLFGGKAPLLLKTFGASNESSSVDGVVSRLKLFNYCKTDFSDSLKDRVEGVRIKKPSEFIELSRDNVTFENVESNNLPFVFQDVLPNEIVPVWVRVNINDKLIGYEKRTANIIGSWNIGV